MSTATEICKEFKPKEVTYEKSIVDKFGYIDQRKRVENLLREGMQLKVHRSGIRPDFVDGMTPKEIMDMKEYLAEDIVFEDKIQEYVRMNNQMKVLEEKFKQKEAEALAARQKQMEEEKTKERNAIIAEYEERKSAAAVAAESLKVS